MMRELEIFNSVSVFDPSEINPLMLSDLRYGGFLTVTQSGSGKASIDALKMAYQKNLTCLNVVNIESSPITKAIDEVQKETSSMKDEKQQVLYNSSDEEDFKEPFYDKNIGIYMKSGHCYSDIKSFIPQIVCLALVALWFSD